MEAFKKILRSVPSKWRPKVITIEDANDLNKLILENLTATLKSYEMEVIGDESTKKSKHISLKSNVNMIRLFKSLNQKKRLEGETLKMVLMLKR